MNREQVFLLCLLAATALASFLVLLPFLQFVLGALLLGYVLRPLHCRLTPYLGARPAAMATIASGAVAIILPLAYVSFVVYRDARRLASGDTGLALREVEAELSALTGEEIDLVGLSANFGSALGEYLAGNAPEIVSYLTYVALGVSLVLFLVYYVLVDGPDFVQWAVQTAPLDGAVAHELVIRMDRMTWGVVAGHIFVGLVQGVVGGVGLWVAGIPNATFWAVVMAITALLPVIGAFLVWGPAVFYLVLLGDLQMATLLLVWGLIPVSLVDNFLRSIVIDQSADVNPGVILIGVVGGIYTFGAIGLFVGPLVIGLLAATVRAFDTHYDELARDTPPPSVPDDGRLGWLETNPAATQDDLGGHAEPKGGE